MDSESQRFKLAREQQRLTLQEVALMTGYSISTISGVENGHDQPSKRLRALLIDRLGLNESWLRTGKGEMDRPVSAQEERDGVVKPFSPEEEAIFADPEMISVINRLRVMNNQERKRWLRAIQQLLDQLVESDQRKRQRT
jgi:transcriptional regulator with XRE-family HTH domain